MSHWLLEIGHDESIYPTELANAKIGGFYSPRKPVFKHFPAHPLIKGAGRHPNGEVESLERH